MGKRRSKVRNQAKRDKKNMKKNHPSQGDSQEDMTNKFNKSINLSQKEANQTRPNGLMNIGNTCYMNSILQVLVHSPLLYDLINQKCNQGTEWKAYKQSDILNKSKLILYSNQKADEDSDGSDDDNQSLVTCLSAPNSLTKAFIRFLREMRTKSSSNINPTSLWQEIGKKNHAFKDRSQHDSHELLRYLLDCIKADEIRRHRKAILSALNIESGPNIEHDPETKNLAKSFLSSSSFTLIDSLFSGYLLSSVKCEECESNSMIFEPFFDLSLSICSPSKFNMPKKSEGKKKSSKSNCDGETGSSHVSYVNGKSSRRAEKRENRNKKNQSLKVSGDPCKEKKVEEDEEESFKKDKLDTSPLNYSLIENDTQFYNDNVKVEVGYEQKKEIIDEDKKELNETQSIMLTKEDKSSQLNLETQLDDDLQNISVQTENSSKENIIIDESYESDLNNLDLNEIDTLDFAEECKKIDAQETATAICLDASVNTVKMFTYVKPAVTTDSLVDSLAQMSIKSELTKENFYTKLDAVNKHENSESQTNPSTSNILDEHDAHSPNKAYDVNSCLNICDNFYKTSFDISNGDTDLLMENWAPAHNLYKDDDEDELINNEADNEEEFDNDLDLKVNGISHSSEDETTELYEKSKETKNRIRTSSFVGTEEEVNAKNKWALSTLSLFRASDHLPTLYSCLASFTSPELLAGSNKIICENCSKRYKQEFNVEKKVYANASKRMLIAYPPPILTLHIKRFEVDARHITLKKINQFISFPLNLNLSPFTSRIYLPLSKLFEDHLSDPPSNSIIYNLYAVVEHSGSIRSGHYTAYIKLPKAGKSLQKFIRLRPFVTSIEEIVESIDYNNFNDFEDTFNAEEERDVEGKWFYISDSLVAASDVFTVLHSQAYLLFYERIK